MRKLLVSCAVIAFLLGSAVSSAADLPKETKEQRDARMAWFRDAKFGMFIHWGPYCVPAGEYKGKTTYGEWFLEETKMPVSQYEKYRDQFNPVKFDAKKWVQIAKDAGVKYIVITSKHHDGFAMYDTKLTNWSIMSTPWKHDPIKDLAEECKKAGIRFCVYHSIMDWHHPDYAERRKWNDTAKGTPDMDRYVAFMKGQLKELVDNYDPGILWFDGEWEKCWTHERGKDLYAYCRSIKPDVIVNNRVGKNRDGMSGKSKGKELLGDYDTPEQEIPANGLGADVAWESCMTLNNHWGFNKNDNKWKSSKDLIEKLIDIASKGGNFLLNVGPTSEGVIPEPSVERLAAMGQWLKVNGESIYGVSACPFAKAPAWGRVTKKAGKVCVTEKRRLGGLVKGKKVATKTPDKLYLHVFNWPKDGKLVVADVKTNVKSAYLLADSTRAALKTAVGANGLEVTVPEKALDPVATVVVLEMQ